jgi:hypothetical protein
LSFLAELCGLPGEPLFKRFCLFETKPLQHDSLLSTRERWERNQAFSSPIDAQARAVTKINMRPGILKCESFLTV